MYDVASPVSTRSFMGDNRMRLAQNPDGILFVSRKAIPALREIGVSEQAIRTMTVEVPRRFFET
jgi:predicted metal-dependent phosphotriesterase family hydrolase